MRRCLVIVVLFITGGGCVTSWAPSRDAEALRVRWVALGIVDADNARDIERVLGFYASDAVLLPPGESPVVGVDAIRPRYEQLFRSYDPAIEATVEEVVVAKDLAYVRGHNGGRVRGREGIEDRALDDVYLMILNKNASGEWKITRLMWHGGGSE